MINEFAMDYDSDRQVVVAFGGQGPDIEGFTNNLWEWNGTGWTNRTPVYGPQARRSHAMVFDAGRHVHVMFGGMTDAGLVNDTWEYDGTQWRAVGTSNQPTSRDDHCMAYDAQRQRVVLFGGSVGGGETWTYDGLNWILSATSGPPASSGASMCYDVVRRVIVLFTTNGQTWEWNGTSWLLRNPPTGSPTARNNASLAFDATRGVCVLNGGSTGADETWNWDGTAWTRRIVSDIGSRRAHNLAFDAARGVVVAFGGDPWAPTPSQDDAVATWNGVAWSLLPLPNRPLGRMGAAFAFDTVRQRAMLFGGEVNNAGQPSNDMWELNPQTSTWAARTGGPPAGMYNQMAFDGNRNVAVMVVNGQTWEFNGVAWGLRATTGPTSLRWEALAWDPFTGVTRLSGGSLSTDFCDASNGNRTLEWDGISWLQVAGQGGLWPRGAVLVPDLQQQNLRLLFGVSWFSRFSACVGSNRPCTGPWSQCDGWATPNSAGESLSGPVLVGRTAVWHADLHDIFSFGGNGFPGGSGIVASPKLGAVALSVRGPSPRNYHAMWYDDANRVLLFGGSNNRPDLWRLESYGPSFTEQPQSQTGALGSTVTFQVTVANSGAGAALRWRKNGTPLINGGRISGVFTNRLQITGLVAGDAGQFDCSTSSDCGAVTSQTATLTVVDCLPITITQQPVPVQLIAGQTAIFSIAATGSSPQYRWRRNSVDLIDGGRISGAGSPTLTIAGVQNADQGVFTCLVNNACGSQTSTAVELSCRPIIAQQPPTTAKLSAGLALTVGVPANATYSFRWRQNGQNLFNVPNLISGATTRTLTLLNVDPSLVGSYDCVLTSTCGTTTSNETVIPCPSDYNQDGGVDGGDIEAFFIDWMAGTSDADLNQDGGVDGSDIEFFFLAWESGC